MLTSSRSSQTKVELVKTLSRARTTHRALSGLANASSRLQTSSAAMGGVRGVERSCRHVELQQRLINGQRRLYNTEETGKAKPLFDKILIANRGEIACRVMKTAKKLGIKTVAVYSEVDRNALHVKMADEAYYVGPAPSADSYLRMDKIIQIAKQSGAQAIHPGYGFLSENAKFATALEEAGITFIGPPVTAITSMASKSESKDIMIAAGVPCVPGYHGSNQDPQHLLEQAKRIQFPVLIKAVLGGGGKGMRIVHKESEFLEALESAKRESLKSFSDDNVLVEKYIQKPRHIEVQVFGDTMGDVAPAPGISEEIRKDLCDKAVAAAKAVGYVGAGTVEFIFDDDTKVFYFMEMNTRLQVEHPVTEMITGQDLVEWQLHVAAGNPLPLTQNEIPLIGHAFEARIYAENPRNNFMPDVGKLVHLSTPEASSIVRLEEGFKEGSSIEVFYDPLIAKLVVKGSDRTEALRVLRKALEEYQVVGLSTNIEFLRTLAGHPAFIDAEVETGFIPKHYNELFPPLPKPTPSVLAQSALYLVLRDLEKDRQLSSSTTSPWSSLAFRRFGGDVHKRIITLKASPKDVYHVHVTSSSGRYHVQVHSQSGEVLGSFENLDASLQGPKTLHTEIEGRKLQTTVVSQLDHHGSPSIASAEEKLHIFAGDSQRYALTIPSPSWLLSLGEDAKKAMKGGGMRAPMPSVVVDVKVANGDMVKKGQAIVVLESMKTETVLRAEQDGKVVVVACKKGDMVEEGTELAIIEPLETIKD
ncbi:Methylcrotonoyl-CoA carboxylase subunit alpha, mitochondrial Short=MCCase subunit alpha; AltName: Full=3-methylcrotonyl-CoA carboxylase 1; AltName: Full=3-methylcrotonyl-CoA carboxylase biotin-containing subunit; AltName: Full=3-methylcrotonyl-CoA:carbon dioxide ligase subunit alpha; Flags: Precursor [Serendipita indica DSM 11827]|nr:Methylcrotonoyl-CoA carboxylase subunit alpha, mitochondrial Short=MCCase subunit alpha; AltName: Full=3-methylcrotonyl-CoA carboxylase 1; AltName: Full=3-methylcrotonyl-CoA carboxylase biotin-containing subunit; AltName: Full=3-methylcrotonyl-CoA:carbon dioxide ligase subunit alpha; Flags: Precursor [Serendipita indica DSM 11827]